MSGRVKNRVLGTSPGSIQSLGSRSPGPGWQGFRGLEATLLLPVAPPIDGSGAQVPPGPGSGLVSATKWTGEPAALQPLLEGTRGRAWARGWTLAVLGLLGREKGVPIASAARFTTETLGEEEVSKGWSKTVEPREAEGESGGTAGRVRVQAVLSSVPAGPALAAPPEWLEEAIGEGTAGGAVEVLKILAKRDPRSNTATFMSQSWRFCPRCCLNLKNTGSRASELHPPLPTGIGVRRPGARMGIPGTRKLLSHRGP